LAARHEEFCASPPISFSGVYQGTTMNSILKKAMCWSAAMGLLAFTGCKQQGGREARYEKPIPVTTPLPQKSPEPAAPLPPPTSVEVAGVLSRVFADDLRLASSAQALFIAGDFNGDDSQDLAMIVRPAPGKLEDINSELANWIIQDADVFFVPPSGQHVVTVPKITAAKVMEGETVLAVVHGYGRQGWRNPDARQGYLVKHAAATFLSLGPSIAEKSIRQMHLPVRTEIIYELRNKKRGFLFWTGQAYAWHPSEG